MRNLPKRSIACILTALFLVSVIPPGVAAQDAEEHYTFGIEYDWSNLDVDAETLTGLSIRDILLDVSKAADDSGFVLLLAQETTGTSTIIHDQYTGADTTFKFGGSDVPATPHYTKITIRHGMMADAAIMTDWSDSSASWDVTLTADSENILVMDMLYVEYRDANNKMMGASMDQSMTFTQGIELGIVGTLTTEAYTDEETQEQHSAQSMPLDASLDMGMTYQIINNHADLVLGAASDLPNVLTQVNAGERLEWACDSRYSNSSTDTSEGSSYDEDTGEEYMQTTHYVSDSCGDLTGSYESKTTVNFEVKGLPAEELGYPAGDWDVSIIDSITSTGDYSKSAEEEEYWDHSSSMELGDSSAQKITIDGNEISVFQTEDAIIPFGFEVLLGMGMEKAIVGSAETVFDSGLLNGTILDAWSNDLAEESNNNNINDPYYDLHSFTCDDGEQLEIYEWQDVVNDGYQHCYDGSDEGVSRIKVNPAWDHWNYDHGSPSISASLQNFDDKVGSDMKDYTIDFSMNSKDMATSASSGQSDSIQIDSGNSNHYVSLVDMYPDFNFSSMYPDGDIGDTICITVKLYDDTNYLVSEDSDCGWAGDRPPQISYADFEADGSEEFRARFNVDSLNQDKDYEISWKMKESDGSTVDAGSFVVQNRMDLEVYYDGCNDEYCETVSGETDGWGEYCLEIEVDLVGGENNPMATDEVCRDLAQEPEPSEKIITMLGAFMQSTVDNTMESFDENLENRLEKYEADIAYDSAEMYSLWSKEQGRIVGIQLLVGDSDSGNTFTLVGPESNMYPKALSPINVIYFSGTEAIEQEAAIVDDITIESLVDLTKHNTAAVDAVAVGQDPTNVDTSDDGGNTDTAIAVKAVEDKGLLPFISPVATVAMIALAGIFVAVPRKD
jgi:hypothetical protein